jgi:hypothetical protein
MAIAAMLFAFPSQKVICIASDPFIKILLE